MSSKHSNHPALNGMYILQKTLGSGGFAKVKLAIHVLTGEKVAIKIMNKAALGDDLPRIKLEMEALKVLSHQNICKLYQIIETNTHIYIVLEYCPGGELFDYIIQKERLSEEEARLFFRQIVAAVAFIHKYGYAHRDLKPENLLLLDNKTIKLIDFGLCAKPKGGLKDKLDTCCGSPAYAAPELLSGAEYNGSEVDVWSMGILLYALLCGFLPFDDENVTKLYRKIQKGKYSCPPWLSSESQSILSEMLQVNPLQRIPVSALMMHPWLVKGQQRGLKWRSIYEKDSWDQGCLVELAMHHKLPMKYLATELQQNKFDYLTSTYLLLLARKQQGKVVRLVCNSVKEPKLCNRNLNFDYDSSPMASRYSLDDLEDSDLLLIGSPTRNVAQIANPKSPVYLSQQFAHGSNKENFAMPVVLSPRKRKATRPSSYQNAAPMFNGLSASADISTIAKMPVTQFLSIPLENDKRTKSLDSPLWPDPVVVSTPTKKPMWENGSLSAKKMFGSIEKSIDRMKNMLTPSKRLGGSMNAPRKVKTLCNVSATNEKVTPDELLDSLQLALVHKGIPIKQKGYSLTGKVLKDGRVVLKFELEVCRLPRHHVIGVRRKRLVGDAWHYKKVCEEVLKMALLVPRPQQVIAV